MGHSIQHYKFDENESRNRIAAITDEDAINQGDYGEGLSSEIRYIDELYDDENEAYKAIKKHDKGWYDQLAVKFYEYESVKETKAIENLRARLLKYREDISNYKSKNSVRNRKSKLVGCDECGSRINKDYVPDFIHSNLWNCCPLCHNNLSSETIKTSIESKMTRIHDTEKTLDEAIRLNNKKGKKKIMWLVKTEFHV